ncbi:MAG: lipopolysaccharide biosynthesis protein RfbH [Mucilaginibacter sp.]|nr:lipopolysaccharide biosynthesis protein RfbH [Mucilaginibacter sp.]
MLKNITNPEVEKNLREIAKQKTTQIIIPGTNYIPVTGKVLDEDDVLSGIDATLDAWLTAGRFANQFEHEFDQYSGVPKALLINSGSSANLVAFYALTSPKLGARQVLLSDEVIIVAAGFPTTVNPMVQYGCIPVFVDVDIATHNVKAEDIEAAVSPKTKAI